MVPFVEDDAADATWCGFLLLGRGHTERVVDGGLVQHEGVVGDDDRGIAPRPHRAFDEAAPVMRASGIDAFAAPVGEAQRLRRDAARFTVERQVVEQRQDPRREVATHHVAVAREARPARDQGRQQRGARVGGGQPPEDFLHVEQADIVLAPLADDDLALPFLRVLDQARGFLIELALQVLGVGRDPHGGVVPAGPQKRRREIAQRLAQPRARFGE